MTQAATADPTADRRPDVTLEYGRPQSRWRAWWNRGRADVQERLDGFYEFLGPIIYALGGWRRIFFAFALSMVLAGFGLCIERGVPTGGPGWMGVGGFILGFVIPLQRSKPV
jgi:hypothetical protein